jgi:acyl-CoA reductase-like NAD-dependent aldehyde dehydrogenase
LLLLRYVVQYLEECALTDQTADNGKAVMMARHVDLVGAISCFRFYAGWADKLYGQTMEMGPGAFAYTKKEPFGVCGQISESLRVNQES